MAVHSSCFLHLGSALSALAVVNEEVASAFLYTRRRDTEEVIVSAQEAIEDLRNQLSAAQEAERERG